MGLELRPCVFVHEDESITGLLADWLGAGMAGDVNLFFNDLDDATGTAEIEVRSATALCLQADQQA